MNSFYICRLGCPKNDVDADTIAGFLERHNLRAVDSAETADLVIVNSCGFIQPAKEESIEAILSLIELKKKDPRKKVVVTGCLSQRYATQLERDIPELDGIFGLDSWPEILHVIKGGERVVSRHKLLRTYTEPPHNRAISRHEPFAYIKISDGCDNRCRYCAIPDIRGPYRSRVVEAILDEAKYLLDNGKKELILVSQESTAYGCDRNGRPQLIPLLERLSRLDRGFWIRVMYMHPARVDAELIDYMIDNEKICNYFDLPIQHINDAVLQAMGRKVTRGQVESILDAIRSASARAAIRTNFIVGFPGETDDQFEELCRFVKARQFDRMGAFEYSEEEGTPAAAMPGRIDDETRQWRYHRLMEIQQEIAFARNAAETGASFEVLVDAIDYEGGISVGRTRFDAPEIDQTVRLSFTDAAPGDIITVTITGHEGYDLLGGRRTA